MEMQRIRRFLGLRQIDIYNAVGISISRLSAYENGRASLNSTERRALEEFYQARLRMLSEANRKTGER